MQLGHFHTLRTGIQINASPASGHELASRETALRDMLLASGLFESVEVENTDDPDRLVIGLCEFRPELSEDEVARAIERLWDEGGRYPFWEAHALVVEPEHVEFEAATRAGESGHYVTVHMVATRARIPVQRLPRS